MNLDAYIAKTIEQIIKFKGVFPKDIDFDIALTTQGGWHEGKLVQNVIIDESPSAYSSRIKFKVTIE